MKGFSNVLKSIPENAAPVNGAGRLCPVLGALFTCFIVPRLAYFLVLTCALVGGS